MKKGMKLFLTISLILIALMIAFIICKVVGYNKKYKRENLTLDQYIAFVAYEETNKIGSSKSQYRALEEEDNFKKVYMNAEDAFSGDLLIYDITDKVVKIMKRLSVDPEFMEMPQKGISFLWVIKTIDAYGNIGEALGMEIAFIKEDIQKIKWDTVMSDGIKKVAHSFWVSELMQK